MRTQNDRDEIEPDLDPQRGQGLAEYALILALIAVVSIVALGILGGAVSDALNQVGQSLGVPAATVTP